MGAFDGNHASFVGVISSMKRMTFVVPLLLIAAACSSGGHRSLPAPTSTSVPNATTSLPARGKIVGGALPGSLAPHGICSHEGQGVIGTLRMVGGPAGASADAVAGTVTAAADSAGTLPVHCSTMVGADGRFALVLAPGTWRLTGRSPSFNGGTVDCAGERVVVLAQQPGPPIDWKRGTSVVNVDCQRR
jgi:hypothetical protein